MKTFWILLVLTYARSEKLDLTYLPPPGSQYAGGRPEDIQVPLEFPKETYTTTLRPQDLDSGITNPEDYQATIGINRGLPSDSVDDINMTPGPKAPFSYFQNTYKVPTTTVSYAFTQTTTHPPIEGFETTIGPQFDGTGYPSQDTFNNFQPQEPSLTYQGNIDQPGFKQTSFGAQTPTASPVTQYPGYLTQGPVTGINQQAQNHPGFQQNIGQFSGQRPTTSTTGPFSQFTGSSTQPQESVKLNEQDLQAQNMPEYKPSENQFSERNPIFAPASGLANKFPTIPKQNLEIVGASLHDKLPSYPNQQQPGYQHPTLGVRPGIPFGQTQYQNQTLNKGGLVNQPDFVSSTLSPQELFSTSRPGIMYGNRANNIQGSSTPRPNSPQTSFSNQIGAGQIVSNDEAYQRQPESQLIKKPTYYGNKQNIYQPSSTVVPTTFTPDIQNGQRLTGTSVVPEIYSTPVYPETQYINQIGKEPNIYGQSPERFQADTDRNAVILSYENVITPEGFAYSYDTSNGIHADESGTAINGVKAKGSYSYIGDDGKLYSVVYTADENGYQPHGDHLPTPPPIPEAIKKIIEKVKKEKEAGIYHDGSYDDDKYGHKKYQGAMNHGPQTSNKVLPNGAKIPEDYFNDTVLQDIKPRRPLSGLRKPIVSSGDLTDFDVENERPSQYGDNEYDTEDEKVSDQILKQRPNHNDTAINREEKDGNMQDGGDQNQYFEVSSKRPSKQPTRKLISKINGSSRDNNGDKRQPSDKMTSQHIEDQGSFKYGPEGPYYEDVNSNTQFSTAVPSKYPTNQNRPQYGQENTESMGTFKYNNNSKRPLTPESSKRPVINVSEQSFDDYENTRPSDKFSGRRPSDKPVIGDIQDQFQTDEIYNIQKGSNEPSYKPFEYSDDSELRRVTDNYKNEEYVTKSPSRIQPDGTKPTLTSASRNQIKSTGRRPDFIPETSDTQNDDVDFQPDGGEKYIGSDRFENMPFQKYGDRRPIAGKPTITYGEKYKETEQESNENIPKRGYTDRSQPASTAKYGGTRVRPQASRPLGKLQTSDQDNRGQVLIGDTKYNVPGAKFGQKLIKPYIYHQTSQVENVDFNQQPDNETGYQYVPPRRKFEQDEAKSFPVMYTGTPKVPSRRPPQQNVFYEKEEVKSKPFMTPNVSRDDTGFTVDEYDQEEGTPEIIPGKSLKQQNQFNTQYPDSGTTPDQLFGDEIIASTKSPSKYTSSTYGPSSFPTQPLRPQYNQKTQNVPGVKNNVAQIENHRPVQDTHRINGNKYTKVPYGGVSSTTPLPSNGPYYGSTYGSTTPEEQSNYVSDNTYQKPGQGLISSTTPLPSQKPNYEDYYQQNTNEPQYQSTFRPAETVRPTTKYIDVTTAQRLTPVSSTYSTSNVGPYKNTQYGNDLPSTTYRPNIAITGVNEPTTTKIPGIVVDGFGRPIRPEYSSTVQDYTPGSTSFGQPISDQNTKVRYQPGETSSAPFRGQQRYRPDTKLGQQGVTPTFQSTTQRIIGEDFSGPKQQQKFDPITGYYYK